MEKYVLEILKRVVYAQLLKELYRKLSIYSKTNTIRYTFNESCNQNIFKAGHSHNNIFTAFHLPKQEKKKLITTENMWYDNMNESAKHQGTYLQVQTLKNYVNEKLNAFHTEFAEICRVCWEFAEFCFFFCGARFPKGTLVAWKYFQFT